MITAQMLLTELGNRAWSGFNKDDMIWENEEDSAQAKAELNSALRYLINDVNFPFKVSEQNITATPGSASYRTPQGQILKVYDKDTLEELSFIGDSTEYDKTATGKPTSYWVDYKNPKTSFRLYPIPDDNYSIGVVFNHFEPVIDAEDSSLKFQLENADDYINIPFDDDGKRFNLEWLFMDCLVLQTMIQNNKDEQDENYRPTIDEFNKRWRQFKELAEPVRIEPRIVW